MSELILRPTVMEGGELRSLVKMQGMVYKLHTNMSTLSCSQHSITEANKSEAERHFEGFSKETHLLCRSTTTDPSPDTSGKASALSTHLKPLYC